MWALKGYELLYDTSQTSSKPGPWYDCVPINRVLGLAPLIPLYRNLSGTIPEWDESEVDGDRRNPKKYAYPVGKAGRSKTYVLNKLALSYAR